MSVFVDTSAFYALLDIRDRYHTQAREILTRLAADGVGLLSHDHVLGESVALVNARLGRSVSEAFIDSYFPLVEVEGAGGTCFETALASFRRSEFGSASLVDVISFLLMREFGIDTAFAFDADFEAAGFQLLA